MLHRIIRLRRVSGSRGLRGNGVVDLENGLGRLESLLRVDEGGEGPWCVRKMF
jgi:hypothetical protein